MKEMSCVYNVCSMYIYMYMYVVYNSHTVKTVYNSPTVKTVYNSHTVKTVYNNSVLPRALRRQGAVRLTRDLRTARYTLHITRYTLMRDALINASELAHPIPNVFHLVT